jgi:hypothetical protein
LARKLKLRLWEGDALDNAAYELTLLKNYPRSLNNFFEGLNFFEDKETEKNIWRVSIFSETRDSKVTRLTA